MKGLRTWNLESHRIELNEVGLIPKLNLYFTEKFKSVIPLNAHTAPPLHISFFFPILLIFQSSCIITFNALNLL